MRAVAAAILALAFACGHSSQPNPDDAGIDAGVDAGVDAGPDPAPVLSAQDKAALASLSPATLPAPPADISNSHADDPAAAALGQKLFMDPSFSGALLDGDNDGSQGTLGNKGDTGKVSCASCHQPGAGFADNRAVNEQRAISLAAGWNLRHTPSLLDVGQSKLLMWDGGHDALYNQPFRPVENPNEMNSSRLFLAEQIYSKYKTQYEAVFGAMPDLSSLPQLTAAQSGCDRPLQGAPTCHGMPGDGAEYDSLTDQQKDDVTRVVVNFGKALGAYERLLSCGQGRFDKWVAGDDSALNHSEQRGAQIFVGKGNCISCHTGAFLSDEKFHDVGLKPATVAVDFIDIADPGAQSGLATSSADPLNVKSKYSDGDDGRDRAPASTDAGAFRTPKLRCVSGRPAFMHTGQMSQLADVVSFFSAGGDIGGFVGTNELAAINLSAQEQADLTAFLSSLQGPGPAASLLQ